MSRGRTRGSEARVLHVIESLEIGGAERVVVDLANRQRRAAVACLKRGGDLAACLDEGVELYRLDKPEGFDLATPGRLARLVRSGGFDLVHTHAWGVFLDGALAARRAGVVHAHTAHGPLPQRARSVAGRGKAALRHALERRLAHRCRGVAAVSDSVAALAREHLGIDAVRTIRNGVADSVSTRPAPELGAARGPRLVSVGRLDAVKDQRTLLRALANLTGRWPGIELLLVGDGPERGALERQAELSGVREHVRFLGARDDVDALLAAADLFVMSSLHEGISIAMLEAMRAGLPIVATDVGGVSETVIDGESALLVAPGEADALARAIGRLLRDPDQAARLGMAAARRQRRIFSAEAMTAAYQDLYDGLASGHGAGRRSLRVLYHHRTQGRGAEGVHIASIVHALEGMGHRVTVVGPAGTDPLRTAGEAPVDKSDVATRGAGSVWKWVSRRLPGALFELAEIGYNLVAWRALRRALRAQEFDLVYERYAFYLVAGAWLARRHGVPFVLEANEISGLEDRARPQRFPRLCGAFERFLLARVDGVLTVSSYLAGRFRDQGVEGARVRVVPNAVDDTVLHPVARDRALEQRYGLTGRTVLGFVGWFDAWDRLDLLLEVCARLKPEQPSLAALLVGDGPAADELRDRVRQLGLDGDVVLTGAVPRADVHRHMALLDVAVLPHSNCFGSPVVLFEMMARRVPVVAPRLAPIEDVLEHDRHGLLFEPLDLDGLTDAVRRLLVDASLRRRLASAAHARLLERHTWTRNAEQILAAAGYPEQNAEPSLEVLRAS